MIEVKFIPWWEKTYFDEKLEYSTVKDDKQNLYILLPVFKDEERQLIKTTGQMLVIDNSDNRFKKQNIIKFIEKEREKFLSKWTFVDKSIPTAGLMNINESKVWIEEGQHSKLYLKEENIL